MELNDKDINGNAAKMHWYDLYVHKLFGPSFNAYKM